MTVSFAALQFTSPFRVGERVRVDIATLYKKPPYDSVEGVVYQVRVEFPLLSSTKPGATLSVDSLTFRYGIQADTKLFPRMKDVENELFDLPEDNLSAI